MTRLFVSLGEMMRPYIYRRADCSDRQHFKVCLYVRICVCAHAIFRVSKTQFFEL